MSEQQQELSQEEIDAQFEAGFTGKPLPAATQQPEEEATETQTETTEPEQKTEAEDEAPQPAMFAGFTEDQIKQLLAKASEVDKLETRVRDLYGRFGEANRLIQELRNRPAGQKLTAPQLKRLSAEYPEFAEALSADLSEAFVPQEEQPKVDINELLTKERDSLRGELTQEYDQKLARTVMNILRPSWEQEVMSDDFRLFYSFMPQAEREVFDSSWDPNEVNSTFVKYDAWKSERQKAAEKQVASIKAAEEKKKRLDAAVLPRGTSTELTPSDDDAFEAGFNAVRGRKI